MSWRESTPENVPEESVCLDRGVGLSGLHLAAFLAFVVLAAFFHLSCVDIGFHVRTGELVWQTRSIPATNTFSSVHAEAPWLLHQWLPGLAFYGAWQWGGVGGAIALRILLVVACYMAVACHPHVRSARPVWLVLLLLTAPKYKPKGPSPAGQPFWFIFMPSDDGLRFSYSPT